MPRNGREQVNIAVEPDTKSEWREAVEETGRYTTLTQLIRQSVENELTRIGFKEGVDAEIPGQDAQQVDVGLSSVEEELSELKEKLMGVSQKVERTNLIMDAQQDTELMDLTSTLHDELPRLDSPEALSEKPPIESGAWEGQPWRLAQDVDGSEYDVTRALALLEQQMSREKVRP